MLKYKIIVFIQPFTINYFILFNKLTILIFAPLSKACPWEKPRLLPVCGIPGVSINLGQVGHIFRHPDLLSNLHPLVDKTRKAIFFMRQGRWLKVRKFRMQGSKAGSPLTLAWIRGEVLPAGSIRRTIPSPFEFKG
jgi:hypothetical protein